MTKVLLLTLMLPLCHIVRHMVGISTHKIRTMSNAENILYNDKFFADAANTLKNVLSSIKNEYV